MLKLFPRPIRIINKMLLSNNVSARIQLSVLGNGSAMGPSAIVTTDKISYLFNCGEGTQRMIIEHNRHLKLSKLDRIFFTSTAYENWSGFFGFVLTMAEIKDQIDFYGPGDFSRIVKLYEQFIYSAGNVKLNHIITDNGPDQSLMVKDVLNDDDFVIKSLAWPRLKSTAYVLLAKDKTGKLLIEKCKELKIQPGPKFAALKNGNTIEIDGRIIEPKDVLGPPELGTSAVILECRTMEHLDCLIKLGNFSHHLDDRKLEVVVHMTSKNIFDDPKYQRWIKDFGTDVRHLVLNRDNQFQLGLVSSSQLQIKLNMLDPNLFQNLQETQLPVNGLLCDSNHVIDRCPTLLTYRIRPKIEPKIQVLDVNCCQIDEDAIRSEILAQPDAAKRLKTYREDIENPMEEEIMTPNDVLFLGTGSSQPGKQRNTSAIMVNMDNGRRSMMMDCGESTYLQMCRYFGRENVGQVLANIRCVFLSHYHADHHFGIVKLLKERPVEAEPMVIVAPYSILSFLRLYAETVENISSKYTGLPCEEFLYKSEISKSKTMLQKLGLDDLTTVLVPHCFESYGLVIQLANNGKKIVYSGDSMYSKAFDEIGSDCDLLIHEATMDDDLIEEARYKRHSTISQAIRVGMNIRARFTLLTHFSQRYAKIAPPIASVTETDPEMAMYIERQVGVAFDFMRIPLDDNHLSRLARLRQPLETVFTDEIQRMQDVAIKRSQKRKLMMENVD